MVQNLHQHYSGLNGPMKNLAIENSKTNPGIKWSSLFGVKPSSKFAFPEVNNISHSSKGIYAINIPDSLIDHSVKIMELTLVGKFAGSRPNINIVRSFMKQKWSLKGQVEIAVMTKGFFSFEFTNEEDLSNVLCGGPWMMGKVSLVS